MFRIGGKSFTAEELHDLLSAGGGIHPMMLAEAVASVELSKDPEGQTHSLDEADERQA